MAHKKWAFMGGKMLALTSAFEVKMSKVGPFGPAKTLASAFEEAEMGKLSHLT